MSVRGVVMFVVFSERIGRCREKTGCVIVIEQLRNGEASEI